MEYQTGNSSDNLKQIEHIDVHRIDSYRARHAKPTTRTKETLFTFKHLNHLRRTYQRQRQRIAHKFGNPRLTRITFHTFRHWKATTEYHKAKDILYVMQLLGHKNIKNTLIYTQLISTKDDDFVCKAAKTVDEATKLVKAGFEFVCEIQDCRLFRKRK